LVVIRAGAVLLESTHSYVDNRENNESGRPEKAHS
jgi:hypothetical protein